MAFFYEIFPVFLFFMAFKFYGMYIATIVGIIATFIQALVSRVGQGKWDKKQLITLGVFLFFGGLTLYFHDPIFVKWKPTVIFWIFSAIILISHWFTQKPLIQRLMEGVVQGKGEVPLNVWKKLNIVWAVFFLVLGTVNLYVAYHFSSETWVNFKFYGVTSALLLLTVFQAFCLMRYLTEDKN